MNHAHLEERLHKLSPQLRIITDGEHSHVALGDKPVSHPLKSNYALTMWVDGFIAGWLDGRIELHDEYRRTVTDRVRTS